MMTANQLQLLRTDLQSLAGIEYDDVLNELLDHYATLTEQRIATGLSFEDASKWAWAELGSGVGIQAIQDDYVKNIQRQIRVQHLDVLKSYFRWPTFVVTALVALLAYMIVPLLPTKEVVYGFWAMFLIPSIILVWGHRKSVDQRTKTGPIVFKYMQRSGGIFVNLAQAMLSFSGGFFGHEERATFLQTHASITVAISLLMILYVTSFIQLFRQQFTLRIA